MSDSVVNPGAPDADPPGAPHLAWSAAGRASEAARDGPLITAKTVILYGPGQRRARRNIRLLLAAAAGCALFAIIGQRAWHYGAWDGPYELLGSIALLLLFAAGRVALDNTGRVVASNDGLRVRADRNEVSQAIPWREVDSVALRTGATTSLVVSAYRGDVVQSLAVDPLNAEDRFAELARLADRCTGKPMGSGPVSGRSPSSPRASRIRLAEARLPQMLQANRLMSWWAPDPSGRCDLRFFLNGSWTSIVVTDTVQKSDPPTQSWPATDWALAAPSGWRSDTLLPGPYVFRATWERTHSSFSPTWVSAVWFSASPLDRVYLHRDKFVVEHGAGQFVVTPSRRMGSGVVQTAAGDLVGRFPRFRGRFRAADGTVLARYRRSQIVGVDGRPLASIYHAANTFLSSNGGDHTVVLKVVQPVPAPLASVVLATALSIRPALRPET